MWNLTSIEGLNKGVITGVCAILAKPVVEINKDKNYKLGYKVKLSIAIRGDMYLLGKIQRVFTQNGIYSTIKDVESKIRPRPILRIGRIEHMRNFQAAYIADVSDSNFFIGSEDSKDSWERFLAILTIVEYKRHRTAKGLDEILKLKGAI
jgi:hypothetical protein